MLSLVLICLGAAASDLWVPSATSLIKIDGELEDPAWHDAVVTGAFREEQSHAPARPYSDARFLHDAKKLYFVLYAADEDIRTPPHVVHRGDLGLFDHFVMRIAVGAKVYELQFGADGSHTEQFVGAKTNFRSRATLGFDRDGSANDASDEDEEWIVEGAIPFAAFALTAPASLTIAVSRCDTLKDGRRICSNWGGPPGAAPQGRLSFTPEPVNHH